MLICGDRAMRDLGGALIDAVDSAGLITLHGQLGSGKTTLVRGALEARGVVSGVRSPTYTLVEFYELEGLSVAHFDLYRLADPEELEYLGFRDYLESNTLCFVEWPERAGSLLKSPGLSISLEYRQQCRALDFTAGGEWGRSIIQRLESAPV